MANVNTSQIMFTNTSNQMWYTPSNGNKASGKTLLADNLILSSYSYDFSVYNWSTINGNKASCKTLLDNNLIS